ncbi:MAG: 3'-5' exonuclease [Spirochaetia bacterium]|jgi:DNA polymerase III epsilon subunit-like protein|nr:3'-5' exonuclease [Spirochaetia bacterium]
MITSAWMDTETTGIDPRDSGAFEVALLVYRGPACVFERLYLLNPLCEDVRWGEEAFRVHGVTEETVLSYPPPEAVVPGFVADLKKFLPPEKYVFAGYCCGFDYGHVGAMLCRAGYQAADYFSGRLIDVHELAKRAAEAGLLPKTDNRRLETMAKALKIPHGAAHAAMADIKATRRLYDTLCQIERGLRI